MTPLCERVYYNWVLNRADAMGSVQDEYDGDRFGIQPDILYADIGVRTHLSFNKAGCYLPSGFNLPAHIGRMAYFNGEATL